ncbi:MAG: ATP-binding protein [Pseudomonadota bacterium]
MRSLEQRLAVGLALSLLAAFGFLFWGAVTAVSSLSEAYVLARLEHDAEALVGAYGINPRGQPRLREGRISPIYQQPLSGHYFVLRPDHGRETRSRSLWDETLAVEPLSVGKVRVWQQPGPGEQHLLLRAAGYQRDGRAFTLVVAEDLQPLQAQIRQFQTLAFITLATALILIVLLQRYGLRRGFRALDRVRTEVSRVSAGEREQLEDRGPAEIQPLSDEINRLLTQLQKRLQRSRQALGNLAHALKGPLSLFTRDLDRSALPDGDRQRLTRQLERVGTLIERELKRARLAGDGSGQHFVANREIPDLTDAMMRLHQERHLVIDHGTLPETTLPFDREDMLELLGNLLDNACKWASKRVTLRLTTDDALRIRVSDDGPGIPADRRESLLGRGSRLDEQEPGHGLGLAIVRDLVDGYGGELLLDESADLGGLEVRVALPLPAAFTRP